jgi:hypothetical protein
MTGRVLYAGLHVLDHQLIDRDGRLCGKVDDIELESSDDGTTYVAAFMTGPGVLWSRLGQQRLGRWLRAHVADVFSGAEPDPTRVPLRRVTDIGSAVHLAASWHELATAAAEHWVRDHVIGHIPGSRHDADE